MNKKFTFFYGGPFSQWYPSPFTVDGVGYNCAEQYMMAKKALVFQDDFAHRMIMGNKDPSKQKYWGRRVENFNVEVWNSVSKDIVSKASFAKFTSTDHLKNLLLKTAGTVLVEASPYDTIWGIGLSSADPRSNNPEEWLGTNWLGQILTDLRDGMLS